MPRKAILPPPSPPIVPHVESEELKINADTLKEHQEKQARKAKTILSMELAALLKQLTETKHKCKQLQSIIESYHKRYQEAHPETKDDEQK